MALAKLRVALGFDEQWYLPFFEELADLLCETGDVDPFLLITREDCPDPVASYPFVRWNAKPSIIAGKALRSENDFASSLELDWADLTCFEMSLADVDPYYAGEEVAAARLLATQAAAWFTQQRPDCLVVWSGTRLGPRTLVGTARALGIPVVTLETPYFQHLPEMEEDGRALTLHRMRNRTLIWDTLRAPQCGPSQLTRDWPQASTRTELPAFLNEMVTQRRSKFSALDVARFLAGRRGESLTEQDVAAPVLADATQRLFPRPPGYRALLVCGQVDRDSSLFFGQGVVSNWRSLAMAVAEALPVGWVVGFKGHPLDRGFIQARTELAEELGALNPFFRVLPMDVEIHAALGACDAMLCINSTAGIEALIHGKPVLTMGRASYTHAGMTFDVDRPEVLRPLLHKLPTRLSAEQLALRDRFLSYVLYDYLIPCSRPDRMVQRLRQAVAELNSSETPSIATAVHKADALRGDA